MKVTKEVADILNGAFDEAAREQYEYVTPELLLYKITEHETFREAFENCGGDADKLQNSLKTYLQQNMEPTGTVERPEMSAGLETVLITAQETADNCGKEVVELSHLVYGFYSLEESYAIYYMETQGVGKGDLMQELTVIYDEIFERYQERKRQKKAERGAQEQRGDRRAWR